MEFRLKLLFCIVLVVAAAAAPAARERRDVMESMKNAWNEAVRTLSEAGDAVVHVFRPTEKSVLDKVADGVKNLAN